jgi:hypothetical protein
VVLLVVLVEVVEVEIVEVVELVVVVAVEVVLVVKVEELVAVVVEAVLSWNASPPQMGPAPEVEATKLWLESYTWTLPLMGR